MKIQINNETIKLDQQLDRGLIRLLNNKLKKQNVTDINPLEFISIASQTYRVPIYKIRSEDQTKEVAEARFYAMYLIKKHTNLSSSKIGLMFNNRDHSTVLNSVKRFNQRLETNQTLVKGLEIDFKNN